MREEERRDKLNVDSVLLKELRILGYNITNTKLEIMIEKCFIYKESIYLALRNKNNKSQLAFIYFDHFSKNESRCRLKAMIVDNKNLEENAAFVFVEYSKRIKYKNSREGNEQSLGDEYNKYEYIEFKESKFTYDGKLHLGLKSEIII
ncbi:MAG: hypothetical protein HRT41_10040 [Campylobacteraceae bacterium]|nr:hypothetical protein [Campylobacteraceae bacterium]